MEEFTRLFSRYELVKKLQDLDVPVLDDPSVPSDDLVALLQKHLSSRSRRPTAWPTTPRQGHRRAHSMNAASYDGSTSLPSAAPTSTHTVSLSSAWISLPSAAPTSTLTVSPSSASTKSVRQTSQYKLHQQYQLLQQPSSLPPPMDVHRSSSYIASSSHLQSSCIAFLIGGITRRCRCRTNVSSILHEFLHRL